MSEMIEIKTRGLDQLLKALKRKPPVARVGILGSNTTRKSSTKGQQPTNATIGALYEFNDGSRPGGSFLRVPISDRLEKEMEGSGAFDKDVLAEVIRSGTVVPWLKKVAVLAENIVLGAFDSAGYGKWKPSDMRRKKNKQTLVETTQLRNSITSEVKE